MTNKEFYGDKLLAVGLKGNCDALHRMVHGKSCTGLSCRDCEFGITKESEIENVLQWLNAEHEEPPLLENGDDLKPGDWIMVRDNVDCNWYKRQFMCYFDGGFYCVNNVKKSMKEYTIFNVSSWNQARLPMEGE